MSSARIPTRGSNRRTAVAVAGAFFVNGLTFASWSPRLPEVQVRLGVSDGALGLTLLGMGVGGLVASLVSGDLVDRRGSRTVTVLTSVGLSLCLPVLGIVTAAPAAFTALIVLGALDGLTDVAMNAQAVELQRRARRSVISRMHALWSAGAVCGGLIASRAAAAQISIRTQLLVTSAALVAVTLLLSPSLLPDQRLDHPADAHPAALRTARPIVVRLFLVGLAIALAELPPNDWAALMMRDRFDLSAGAAGLGFVATATGMLVGRLVGDHATDRFGRERTRRGGAALAALGVATATIVPVPVLAGAGLFLAGIGLASLFPLLFRAASDLTHGTHRGMAAFSSGARLGFLLASPVIGLIAEFSSIAVAVGCVSGLAAITVAVTRLPSPVERAIGPTSP